MKQIDIIKTYGQKRCLIVEDNPDLRTALKRLLVDFGATDIDTSGNAEEAIDLCRQKDYDIVLSDYNLGKGKSGQQLLEELLHSRTLKRTSIFFLITAETSVQHVVHALEQAPDDYLYKPVNRETLRQRLDAALLRNEALFSVKKALDGDDTEKAIKLCSEIAQKNIRHQNDARKLLGELLCKNARFDQALALYQGLTSEGRALWARVGLASTYLGLKNFDAAETVLNEIIEDNPYCVEALDLQAKVFEGKNKVEQAQHVLAAAVKVSPMSAIRQREMGRVSATVGDENMASHAFRAAIKYSKNSCKENPEDFTHLAQSLTALIKKQPENTLPLAKEAFENLEHLDKRYAKQPIVQIRRALLEADLHHSIGKPIQAKQAQERAVEIFRGVKFSVLENTSTQLCVDCAKSFMALGNYDEGERLLQEVARTNNDADLAIQIDKLLREPLTKEGIAYAAKLNKQGIEFHKQNQFDNAIASFKKVLSELPNHIGLNLNLVQTLVSKHKDGEMSDKEIRLIRSCFQRIGEIRDDSPYKERHVYLYKRFKKFAAQTESEGFVQQEPETLPLRFKLK